MPLVLHLCLAMLFAAPPASEQEGIVHRCGDVSGPVRAGGGIGGLNPGLRPGLMETALQAGGLPPGAAAPTASIADKLDAARQAYAELLSDFAAWCDGRNLPREAAALRAWLPEPLPLTLELADITSLSEPLADANPPADAEWRSEFAALRSVRAKELYALAQEALAADEAALAYQMVHEALHEDPQHADARRILGYRQHEGVWLTSHETIKAKAGDVWHDEFGWLPRDHLPRYLAGERYFKGRWMPREEEQRLRTQSGQTWDVMTEHYLVKSAHSLEESVRMARKLERLYRAWRQAFFTFHSNPAQLARLFAGAAPPRGGARRFLVIHYRDRQEYVEALQARQPNIGISSGYYESSARQAHFFTGHEDADVNLYHEATHQLFSETRKGRDPGKRANFWVVEGVACYFESFRAEGGWCLLGGADAARLTAARYRRLHDDFYVPLSEFAAYGATRLQRDQQIAKLYSQASGLTFFLMHSADGIRRPMLAAYLQAIYAGQDQPDTLFELTGVDAAELDRQYRLFLQSIPVPME